MTGLIIALAVAAAVLFGILTGMLARKKGYTGQLFWLGLLLNIIGLIFVAGLPDKPKTGISIKPAAQESAKPVLKAESPATAPQPAKKQQSDAEVIAVITAAVAAFLGTSADGFVVRSYRRTKAAKPSWNQAGRYEHLNRW